MDSRAQLTGYFLFINSDFSLFFLQRRRLRKIYQNNAKYLNIQSCTSDLILTVTVTHDGAGVVSRSGVAPVTVMGITVYLLMMSNFFFLNKKIRKYIK